MMQLETQEVPRGGLSLLLALLAAIELSKKSPVQVGWQQF